MALVDIKLRHVGASDCPAKIRIAMPVQLRRRRDEVDAMITDVVVRGGQVLNAADDVADGPSYRQWVLAIERWKDYGREILHGAYATDREGDSFYNAASSSIIRSFEQSDAEELSYRREAIEGALNTLESLRERLDLAEEPPAAAKASQKTLEYGRGVFVVHGHNTAVRDAVVATLEKLEFAPIVLSEQPNEGRTLIEKFEDHTLDVGYAVVLLTADDYGYAAAGGNAPDAPNRARQNVILELGYFMGHLGRDRVAALYESGVEPPSDIHGLAYISTSGRWDLDLVRELRAAGYEVDANRLV